MESVVDCCVGGGSGSRVGCRYSTTNSRLSMPPLLSPETSTCTSVFSTAYQLNGQCMFEHVELSVLVHSNWIENEKCWWKIQCHYFQILARTHIKFTPVFSSRHMWRAVHCVNKR